MDEEGDAVTHRHRDRRAWRLAVVITVQSVLVAACLAVTLKVYRDVATLSKLQSSNGNQDKEIFILFESTGGFEGNTTLTFPRYTKNKVRLANNSKICFDCTGPYILHMYVCFKSLDGELATGDLKLQVMEKRQVRSILVANLSAEGKNEVCKGLTSIVHIGIRDEAFLRFNSPNHLKIQHVTAGFSYLLGRECQL